MAGEISKSIGEKGEEVVKKIFQDVLGYVNIQTNLNIDCYNGKEHKKPSTKSDRTSHGIDALIGNISELSNRTLDVGYISVKHTEKVGYRKTDLSKHIKDIALGIECFKKSKTFSDYKKQYNNIKDVELVGILIWFSDLDDIYQSLEEYVKGYNIPSTLDFDSIILLDNRKLSFFIETILKDKNTYGEENVKFVYHNSGLNPANQNYYGKVIPLYYLYSEVLVTRITIKEEVILKFFYISKFEENAFRGMIDLAIDFDKLDSIDKIIFSFKDYVKSESQRDADRILMEYQQFTKPKNIEVTGYFQTLKNL